MKQSKFKDVFATNINKGSRYDFVDYYVTVRDFLDVTDDEEDNTNSGECLHGYGNNRAGVPLNKVHVLKIADNLYVPSLGIIPISKETDSTGKWTIYDGHNRTDALHERNDNGEMEEEELDSLLLIRVVPHKYALEMYVHINNTEKHTNMNKLLNKDLPAGKFLEKLLVSAGMQEMHSNWKRQLFNQACAVAAKDYSAGYKVVSQAYSLVATPLLNTPPTKKGNIIDGWDDKAEAYVVMILRKVGLVYEEIEKQTQNKINKDIKALMKSGRFFGILMSYAASPRIEYSLIFKNVNQLAANIVSSSKELIQLSNDFTKETDQKVEAIDKLLKSNIRSNKKSVSTGFKRIPTISNGSVNN